MYSKNEVFGFYIVMIIILALIGNYKAGIGGAFIGAGIGITASALLYGKFADQIYK